MLNKIHHFELLALKPGFRCPDTGDEEHLFARRLTSSSATSAHKATRSSCLIEHTRVCFYLLLVCWAPICRILPYAWFACCQVPSPLCFYVAVLPHEHWPPMSFCSWVGCPSFKDLLDNGTSCFVASLWNNYFMHRFSF